MQFDMNHSWDRAVALVSSNLQLLLVVAGVFMLLPTLVMYIAIPELATLDAVIDLEGDSENLQAQIEDIIGPILFWTAIVTLMSFVGYIAMIAMMGTRPITVGEALTHGVKSLPTMIGMTILVFAGYIGVAIFFSFVIALLQMITTALPVGLWLLLAIPFFLMMAGYFAGRFSIAVPIVALEGQTNPIAALTRSWKLTALHHWAILGFWALVFIAYIVIAGLINGVVGALAKLASEGGSSFIFGLLMGSFAVPIALLFSGILVAIYEQLTGTGPKKVSEV